MQNLKLVAVYPIGQSSLSAAQQGLSSELRPPNGHGKIANGIRFPLELLK